MGETMKRFFYVLFALIILWLSWEHQGEEALASTASAIPEDAIRLRIIANSDAPRDQWLKRQIRDQVIEQVQSWTGELNDREQARETIEAHLPQVKKQVQEMIRQYGYSYPVDVELGMTSFPTKMYGSRVYPAGEYEALRITIGKGLGQNWWCVLFPPLCFVDMSNGDAVSTSTDNADNANNDENDGQPEVRFFLYEVWLKIKSFFS